MKYARLGIDKKDATALNRDIVPNGQEFSCINPRCECIYYFRDGTTRINTFFRRSGDEHTNGCTIGLFDRIHSVQSPSEMTIIGGTSRRGNWSSTSINSIAQLYEYYSNFAMDTPLSEANTRLKSEFIIDDGNLFTPEEGEIYLIKFTTSSYYAKKNQIKGSCGTRNVTFNFRNNSDFWNTVNDVLELGEVFGGYEMYYLGSLRYYEDSETYFLHSADYNFEILLED